MGHKRRSSRGVVALMGLLSLFPSPHALALQDPWLNLGVVAWTNDQVQLILSCESGVRYVIESSADLQTWTAVLTNSDASTGRVFTIGAPNCSAFYRAKHTYFPIFNSALAAVLTIDFNGNNVTTDSYDSADPAYSTNGLYPEGNLNMTKAGGDVLTDTVFTNSLILGNALIKGHIGTGPGGGTVALGTNGSVGDRAWVEGGNFGIEPGYFTNNVNVYFPHVVLPSATWLPAVHTSGTGDASRVDGFLYDYIITQSGDFAIPGETGTTNSHGIYIATNAAVRLLVTGNVDLSGLSQIHIAYGGSLTVYMTAATFALRGLGVVNENGNPASFYYFGLPANTTFILGANASFTGAIYAPRAICSLGGGGYNSYDFIGSANANSIKLNGKLNFHFDENLRRNGFSR